MTLAAAAPAATNARADEIRAQCPQLADLDLAAFSALSFDIDGARQLLGNAPPPANADIVLRFHVETDGRRGAATAADVMAYHSRSAKRPWHLTRSVTSGTRQRSVTDVELTQADADALDAALADPCFAREPDYAPRTLPLLGNRHETCFDGAIYYLQIERAGMMRTIRHDCRARWRTGEIMLLLRNAEPR